MMEIKEVKDVHSAEKVARLADIVWREVRLTQQVKPVIVSMGSYAASGGYYISCGAEYIVTAPTTLTGSIGVFGLMFNVGEGAREHLGITADVVKTNPSADMGNIFRPLTPAERLYAGHGKRSGRLYRNTLRRYPHRLRACRARPRRLRRMAVSGPRNLLLRIDPQLAQQLRDDETGRK